jgi:hypothetical protein
LTGEDRKVVQCNYAVPVSAAAAGARAYLMLPNPGSGADRIEILLRSRGGRWVQKWEDIRRLEDFRVKTLPPEHPLYGDERIWDYEAAEMAGRMADAHVYWTEESGAATHRDASRPRDPSFAP